MSMLEIPWNPSNRQLRQFAVSSLVILPLVAWLWGMPRGVILGFGIAGASMALIGWLRPALLKPIFVLGLVVTVPIGIVISEVVMLLIFGLVFLPLGLVFRLLRRDVLERRFKPAAKSYWRPKRSTRDPVRYYRQF